MYIIILSDFIIFFKGGQLGVCAVWEQQSCLSELNVTLYVCRSKTWTTTDVDFRLC